MPRRPLGTGADAARHHGAGTDGQTDQHRGLEKANHPGESDCRGDWPLAKDRDVEQVQQIDSENRHQPDRAGAGHDHDMAHNIAGDEACFAGDLQVWHLYALELHTVSPGRDGECRAIVWGHARSTAAPPHVRDGARVYRRGRVMANLADRGRRARRRRWQPAAPPSTNALSSG